MSVARHLNIRLDEYDRRIRTFIPKYEQMLDEAAGALKALPQRPELTIVELGIGTAALASRCLDAIPHAALVGIDADPEILEVARGRLAGARVPPVLTTGNFLEQDLPPSDAVVASLALHHVPEAAAKVALYRRIRNALREGGLLVSADCFPSADPALAARAMDRWRAHLLLSYSETETAGYFQAWAAEDTYFTLASELAMMRDAGFAPDVVWRADPMGVIAARAA